MKQNESKRQQDKQKQVEQINRENEIFGLPQGIYHHINISGHAFTVEITVPAHAVDFNEVLHCTQFLALFSSDETIRNMTKKSIKKMLENSEKEGDNDGE